MSITDFGKAVRKARIDANVTLASMASDLGTSPSFLSALEMGRKKIPREWASRIEAFFSARGIAVSLSDLADVANKSVSLDGLLPAHQMLVAGFARMNIMDEGELEQFRRLIQKNQ